MKQPDCILDTYRIKRLVMEQIPVAEWKRLLRAEGESYVLSVAGRFLRHQAEPRRFMVELDVSFSALMIDASLQAPVPVRYAATFVGYYHWRVDLTDEQSGFAYTNGATILYGAMRDRIYQLSAATFTGPVCLPTVLMAEWLLHPTAKQAASHVAQKTAAKRGKKRS